jgi:glycosyltransferase involved in cell wall biosynthesis
VRHLLDGLRRTGIETELACRGGGPLMAAARGLGVRTHDVAFDKRYLPDKAAAVARIIRDSNIDIVHSHGLLATYYCQLARVLFGADVPLVYHQHGFHHHNHGRATRRPRIAAERWLARSADRTIAVSTSDYRQLIDHGYAPEGRVRLVHYGLPDTGAGESAVMHARDVINAGGRPVIGIVGRLHPQKGVDTFLRAAALIKERGSAALFAVVGVGELEAELHAMGASLGFNGNLRWVPATVPGAAAMPHFDVAVLASRWEGLPLVLLEYMAAKRPIVSTDVQGCLDAIGPAEAEIVPADQPERMADAVVRLLEDRALAQQRAAAARSRFEEAFTIDVMVRRVQSIYNEVAR